MSRYPDPRSVTQGERADSTRDDDARLIYPGVAGRNPLGDYRSRARKLPTPPRQVSGSRSRRGR